MDTPPSSPVTAMLVQLHDGKMTVADVAKRFRTMRWPSLPQRRTTVAEIEADPDPVPDPPGSVSEIAYAFHAGLISIGQYSVLIKAAAEGQAPRS